MRTHVDGKGFAEACVTNGCCGAVHTAATLCRARGELNHTDGLSVASNDSHTFHFENLFKIKKRKRRKIKG